MTDAPPTSTAAALRRFVAALLATSPRRTLETAALTIGVGFFEGVGLLLLLPLLQLIGLQTSPNASGGVPELLGRGFAAIGVTPTLPAVLALYVGVIVAQSILTRRQSIVSAELRLELTHALRQRLYRAIAGSSWIYFSRHRSSTFLKLLTERIDRVASAAYFLVDVGVTAALCLAYFLMALRVSAPMTMIVAAGGGAIALGFRRRMSRARALGHRSGQADTRLHSATSDFLQSMKIAKGYAAEERHAEEFARHSHDVIDIAAQSIRASTRTRQWLTIGSAVVLAVMVYGAQVWMQMPAGSLFLLMFLFARLVPRVTNLYDKMYMLASELPQFEMVEAAERDALGAAEQRVDTTRPITLQHVLELRDLTFRYGDADAPEVLHHVSLSCPVRATTAIVGPSGAGKSTVADLIMGLLVPTAGAVTVDGEPLGAEHLRAWRDQIGYVPQETLLFHDTVIANLRWAKPTATDDQIWDALTMAAADDFVRALPQGLNTIVGDRGVLISGGERQRLSLARALLRAPKLLILDEATSSLDSENERRIQTAIDRLHEQMTIVVITHRLATVQGADIIHVLDGGRLVESGSWTTLLAANGRFRALCDAQGITTDLSRPEVEALARH